MKKTEKNPPKPRDYSHIHSYFAQMLIYWVKKSRETYIRTKGKCQLMNKIQDWFCYKYLANVESFNNKYNILINI